MSIATETHTVKLAEEQGSVLTGRASAAQLVERVVAEVAAGEIVVLDFDGVQAVSPSFADELFGKLATRLQGDRVRFANLSDHLESVARMAEQQRRASDAS
jgi:hypothetical protein